MEIPYFEHVRRGTRSDLSIVLTQLRLEALTHRTGIPGITLSCLIKSLYVACRFPSSCRPGGPQTMQS